MDGLNNNIMISDVEKLAKCEKSISLFTGLGGVALFYLMISRFAGSKSNYNKGMDYLIKIFETIKSEEYVDYDDVLDIGFLLEYLNRNNIAELDVDDLLVDLDVYIITNWHKLDIDRMGNLSFLHSIYYIVSRIANRTLDDRVIKLYEILFTLILELIQELEKVEILYSSKVTDPKTCSKDIEFLFNAKMLSDYLTKSDCLIFLAERINRLVYSNNVLKMSNSSTFKLKPYSEILKVFLNSNKHIVRLVDLKKISKTEFFSVLYYLKYSSVEGLENFDFHYKNHLKITNEFRNIGLLNGEISRYFLSSENNFRDFDDLVRLFFIHNSSSYINY